MGTHVLCAPDPRRGDGAIPVIAGKRISVVLPAYNAVSTLRRTVDEIPREVVDEVLLVDDASSDATLQNGA